MIIYTYELYCYPNPDTQEIVDSINSFLITLKEHDYYSHSVIHRIMLDPDSDPLDNYCYQVDIYMDSELIALNNEQHEALLDLNDVVASVLEFKSKVVK